MCGINGIVSQENLDSTILSEKLSSMNSAIIHRGPDDDGFFVQRENGYALGMAMRRLSIIDLNSGQQPMYSDDGKIVLVFNGEIYNYRELKIKLIEQGCTFKTSSDTEVILRLYEYFSTSAFSMLDGMFVFSVFDKNLDKIFIVRDFFGEKPLYYGIDGKNFCWASELKSLIKIRTDKPDISLEGLNLYFQLTYIPAPFTIYDNIFKLEANHYLEFDCKEFKFSISEISHSFPAQENTENFNLMKKKTHDLVRQSVNSRMVSDVPLGTFLSGGVDSSIISLCLAQNTSKPIDTFSIGFNKKSFDETNKSRTVAKLIKSNHHEFIVSENDMKGNIDQILLNFDEPFADSSSLPSYLVANKTRQHVKVALTGDGGDEVFGGYNKYYIGKLNTKYTSVVPKLFHQAFIQASKPLLRTKDDSRGTRFKLKRLLDAVNYEGDYYFNIIKLGFPKDELSGIFKSPFLKMNSLEYYKKQISQTESLNDFRKVDRITSLEGDMLVKVDRTSMLSSLESRSPFLNKTIWNFTSQLPESFLMRGWNKKYILKEAFKDYFPEGFLDKSKKGFGVPVGDWLRGHLRKEILFYSEKQFIHSQGIFNWEEVHNLVENHLSGKVDNTFRVWTFYCFQKWYWHNKGTN